MVRGTTPAYTIKFEGVSMDDIERVVFSFYQSKSDTLLTIPDEQMHKEDTAFWFRMTQEQTLSFEKGTVKEQIRFKMKSSNAWATVQFSESNADVLYEEVI